MGELYPRNYLTLEFCCTGICIHTYVHTYHFFIRRNGYHQRNGTYTYVLFLCMQKWYVCTAYTISSYTETVRMYCTYICTVSSYGKYIPFLCTQKVHTISSYAETVRTQKHTKNNMYIPFLHTKKRTVHTYVATVSVLHTKL